MFGGRIWLMALIAVFPAQSARDASLARELLAAHNAVRYRIGVPPLRWSERLAARSYESAITMVVYSQFRHTPRLPYGENLYEIRGGNASPAMVVDAWASEDVDYDYRWNRCRAEKCGHYTQIIWRDTTEVGCAMARSSFREVWVCQYSPPGNVVGQRPY
jgi:pathogenesis-related protein 1